MSEKKFTPGTWGLDEEDEFIVSANDCMVVASLSTPDDFPCFDPEDHGKTEEDFWNECRANAHLIAAAPDLYKALLPIVEAAKATDDNAIAGLWDTDLNPDAHLDSVTITVAEMRAIVTALLKARGEEPAR